MNFSKEDRREITDDNLSEIIDKAAWRSIPECPECSHKIDMNYGVCVNADCDVDEVEKE